jgi:hypothetical protein
MKLEAVARTVGFHDTSHSGRRFRAVMHYQPGRYRSADRLPQRAPTPPSAPGIAPWSDKSLLVSAPSEPMAPLSLGIRHGEDPDLFAEVHEDEPGRKSREQSLALRISRSGSGSGSRGNAQGELAIRGRVRSTSARNSDSSPGRRAWYHPAASTSSSIASAERRTTLTGWGADSGTGLARRTRPPLGAGRCRAGAALDLPDPLLITAPLGAQVRLERGQQLGHEPGALVGGGASRRASSRSRSARSLYRSLYSRGLGPA